MPGLYIEEGRVRLGLPAFIRRVDDLVWVRLFVRLVATLPVVERGMGAGIEHIGVSLASNPTFTVFRSSCCRFIRSFGASWVVEVVTALRGYKFEL